MKRAGLIAAMAALAGCEGTAQTGTLGYAGVETRLLDGDLVNFHVRVENPESGEQVAKYAECAAAQYALIRGYGFARHVRTQIEQDGRLWTGDAVYTISPSLPDGLRTIDAEVAVADCARNGIPTV
ncbi:hypothetical protein [Salibaculum sp.]|uniref:hypothetical protein n=1 Tax=Salibaculum sp. TaxID=2855480 RepID=UPI002B49B105|nr:hypothetical protein [Salibaculum sp.]HKL68713.1 hypothetical protein [Salibaculum sp.]